MKSIKLSWEPGVWKAYFGYRFKEPHDLMLSDGTILKSFYPNGNNWSPCLADNDSPVKECNGITSVKDDQVVAFRLVTDEEVKERTLWHFTGKERIKRANSLYPQKPQWFVFDESELIKPHVYREMVNELRDIAKAKAHTEQLRESLSYALHDFERFIMK